MSAESLNCRRASLADEIAICNRAQLRNLHDQMALLYVEVGKQVKDRTRFRQEQRLFISKRRACGGDSNCLKAAITSALPNSTVAATVYEASLPRIFGRSIFWTLGECRRQSHFAKRARAVNIRIPERTDALLREREAELLGHVHRWRASKREQEDREFARARTPRGLSIAHSVPMLWPTRDHPTLSRQSEPHQNKHRFTFSTNRGPMRTA